MNKFFKAAAKGSTLELYVYSDIGADFMGQGVCVAAVQQAVEAAGNFGSITMRINSPGGDAFEGVAISNYLRSLGKPITVFVDGLAASAASILAMAGTKIVMGEASMMMIHNAWTMVAGNAAELRNMAETLDKVSESISSAYQSRTGKSADQIEALMDAETWMSADDAVLWGFADEVASYDNTEALALAKSAFGNSLKSINTKLPASIENFTPVVEAEKVEASNLSLFEARLRFLRA